MAGRRVAIDRHVRSSSPSSRQARRLGQQGGRVAVVAGKERSRPKALFQDRLGCVSAFFTRADGVGRPEVAKTTHSRSSSRYEADARRHPSSGPLRSGHWMGWFCVASDAPRERRIENRGKADTACSVHAAVSTEQARGRQRAAAASAPDRRCTSPCLISERLRRAGGERHQLAPVQHWSSWQRIAPLAAGSSADELASSARHVDVHGAFAPASRSRTRCCAARRV